jgi:DNA primase
MHINDSRKIYKCFACGAAGDAITFVMKHRGLDYVESLKEICNKQGLHFESYQDEKKSNPKIEMGKKILSRAALLYRKIGSEPSSTPYSEFIKNRGLNDETAQTYSLGFANSKNSLLEYLSTIPNETDREFAIATALELSLIKVNPKNPKNHYDTFRDRIIFPIWDHLGQVIGFTSRAIWADQEPKYMNSKDSFLFNKSNLLYGLHLAKNMIREKDFVILVEGNMDQIALAHFGFKNSVAVMGVALGPQSLDRLLTMTKNVYLALDSDPAGFKAMTRMNYQLADKGIVAKYIEFLPEKDPDEFLNAQGALKFQEKIDNAKAAFDVLLDSLIPEKIPELVDKKLTLLNEAFAVLSPLQMQMAATERIVNFSKKIGLKGDANQIITNYSDFLQKNKLINTKASFVPNKDELSKKTAEIENTSSETEINTNFSFETKMKSLNKTEKLLVQELVQLPMLLSHPNVNELLALVESDEVKKYIGKVSKLIFEVDENEYGTMALNLTDGPEYSLDLKEAVAGAIFKYKPRELDQKTKNRLIHDLKKKFQTENLKTKKEELKKLQATIETQEDVNKLLNEISEIERNLQDIKKIKPEKFN